MCIQKSGNSGQIASRQGPKSIADCDFYSKRQFDIKVHWIKQARWVEDGKFFTSSGVSAGMDMSLALIARLLGEDVAEQVATWTEDEWRRDAEWDPFAKVYGLI